MRNWFLIKSYSNIMNYKNKSAVSHLVTYQAQYLKHIASVEEYNTMMFICFALFQIRLFHIRV
jgi:hypothetical protein